MIKTVNRFVIRNIKVPLHKTAFDYDAAAICDARKKLSKIGFRYPVSQNSFAVYKKSVDARKRNEIFFVYSVIFELCDSLFLDESKMQSLSDFCLKNAISPLENQPFEIVCGNVKQKQKPVVVGFGPCGMFAAYVLAKAGFCPVVIERGHDVETRTKDVYDYWKNGVLNGESNVQFGEGGAGTFSDGKLLTRINDSLCSYVLETFYKHGAEKDILTASKPHIGTDKLREIVKNMREEIINCGGEVRFGTKLTAIHKDTCGNITGISTDKGDISTDTVFLAIGHSARDTFLALMQNGITLMPKPFSVGVRIEHLQKNIDRALYGENYENPALPKGEYAVSKRVGERAVYSFCMCPGGTVVASASEDGTIVTNGMSYSARDGVNANSAIAVSISENDYGSTVLGAIDFQRNIEKAAFCLAGSDGAAPIQNLGSFLGRTKAEITDVLPTYTGKTALCDISSVFPKYVNSMLAEGFLAFEKNIPGFSCDSAVLTAPETRTSSPVRIPRDADFSALGYTGLFPCGEGAGYAGGITSAAVDGIRSALSYIRNHKPI